MASTEGSEKTQQRRRSHAYRTLGKHLALPDEAKARSDRFGRCGRGRVCTIRRSGSAARSPRLLCGVVVMRRLSQLLAPLLFAVFMASMIATISLARGRSTALIVLCGAMSCASFTALASWVYLHSRPLSSPDDVEPQPETAAAPADLTRLVLRVVGTVRALLASFPPGRKQRRWDAFERDFWSLVEGSSKVPRQPRSSPPPE